MTVRPNSWAYENHPEHFTNGKYYKVDKDKIYRTNTGLTLTFTGRDDAYMIRVIEKNTVGGRLL